MQITFQSPVSDGDLIIVSKDEKLIISCRKDVFDCRIRLWEIPSGRLIWQKTGKFQEKLALSPDKSLLVGALDKTTILPSLSPAGPSYTTRNDYSIQIWDTKTGTLKRTLPEFESAIDDIEFSSNGKLLVVATRDKVRFWETKTWKIVQTLSFPFPYEMSSLDAVTFSPDAKLIMITERGHQAEIWDWHAKKRLCKLDNSHLTEDMTFSPNGKFIAGGGEQPFLTKMGQLQMRGQRNLPPNDRGISGVETKGALHIWEVSTGKVIKTFYTGESVSSVAFAPDGKTIASGERQGNRIRLWDASDLQ